MSFRKVKDRLKNTVWWREEAPGSFQLFHYIMNCFAQQKLVLGKPVLQYSCALYKDGIATELTPQNEKFDLFSEVYGEVKKDNDYFENLIKPWWKIRENLIKVNEEIVNTDLRDLSDTELAKLYKKFIKILSDFVVYGTFWEIVDPYTEKLHDFIKKKYKLNDRDVAETLVLLSTPERRSFLTQEKMDFIGVCLGKMSVDEFHSKYFWIDSNYCGASELTKKDVSIRVKNELKKKSKNELIRELEETEESEKKVAKYKKEIIKDVKLDEEDKVLFSLISRFGELIDIRKEGMIRGVFSMNKIIVEISRRKKTNVGDLMCFTEKEAIDFLLGKKIDVNEILKRKDVFVNYFDEDGEKIIVGKEAEELYNVYMENIMKCEFKGMVSFSGEKVSGKVCKVLDTKRDKFEEGSILVTTMTRPEFMPMMRKAKAVITDEGGLTCHAAIVSRELKIPCIIGTKVATKILDSGDLVEMDFKNGLVNKIK